MGDWAGGAAGGAVTNAAATNLHALLAAGWGYDGTIAVSWEGLTRHASDEAIVNLGEKDEDGNVQDPAHVYALDPSAMRHLYEVSLDPAGGNVFDGVSAISPASYSSGNTARYNTFDTLVQALDPATDWDTYLAKALADDSNVVPELDVDAIVRPLVSEAIANAKRGNMAAISLITSIVDLEAIDRATEAHRKRALKTHMRGVNRLAGSLADANAVNGSAFIVGMSLLEVDFAREEKEYQSKLELALAQSVLTTFPELFDGTLQKHLTSTMEARLAEKEQVQVFIKNAMSELIRLQTTQLASEQNATLIKQSLNKDALAAAKDEQSLNLEYDRLAVTWDLEMFQKAGNILSSVSGSVVKNPEVPSAEMQAVGQGLATLAALAVL